MRKPALLRVASAAVALAVALPAAAQFQIRNGDRVVFYGDSITDQRLYTTFTETYVLTRFPDLKVDFVHSGWGGDRVTGGGGGPIDVRLKRDVLAYKPTVMTIMLGMNDASYRPFDEGIFKTYSDGYRSIVKTVKAALPAVRFTLIRPSPFDDVTRKPAFEGGYNAVLARYGDFVAGLAAETGQTVADLNVPVVAALQRAEATDHENAAKIIADRVHPGPAGQILMAECLLKAWKAPSVVSSVIISAAGRPKATVQNCRVSNLKTSNGTLSWTQKDKSLPMAVDMTDPVMALAINSSDFMDALNRETLQVAGLTANSYQLKIDGQEVATLQRADIEAGVNLALLRTPMFEQAARVHGLTLEHNNIHFKRWREVQVPAQNAGKDVTAEMAALDQEEAASVAKQRAAAKPVEHRYELAPN